MFPMSSGTLSATNIPSTSSPHRITHHSPPMALVSSASLPTLPRSQRTLPLVASKSIPLRILSPRTTGPEQRRLTLASPSKWRTQVSFFPSFIKKRGKSREELKEELLGAIAPLDRGAEATAEDQERVDQIARQLEEVNSIKEPLKSELLNGKWELLYTTSRSILQPQRPKFLQPNGKIYQAINADTLRAQNLETWPYFNQVTANLEPLSARRVAVGFDTFKILGLIPIKAPKRARGELEITYLDEELRVSRGDKGNLFILKMVDPSYRVPLQ